jgi:serine/threonine protein kinase
VTVDKGRVLGLLFGRYNMSLDDMVRQGHHIDVTRCPLDLQSGMSHLYAMGFVHCDIKPDNIFVDLRTQQSRYVIGDFDAMHK